MPTPLAHTYVVHLARDELKELRHKFGALGRLLVVDADLAPQLLRCLYHLPVRLVQLPCLLQLLPGLELCANCEDIQHVSRLPSDACSIQDSARTQQLTNWPPSQCAVRVPGFSSVFFSLPSLRCFFAPACFLPPGAPGAPGAASAAGRLADFLSMGFDIFLPPHQPASSRL